MYISSSNKNRNKIKGSYALYVQNDLVIIYTVHPSDGVAACSHLPSIFTFFIYVGVLPLVGQIHCCKSKNDNPILQEIGEDRIHHYVEYRKKTKFIGFYY